MAVERTLTIIKPDAVAKGVVGQIIDRFERAGLTVLAARLVHLTPAQAAGFYIVHKDRPFYQSLCAFMTQGPCLPMVLEGDRAIQRLRDLMGATDPAKAAARHRPPGLRLLHRGQRRPRFRLSGIGGVRDPVLLRRDGDPASLTRDPGPASADPLTFPAVLGTRQRILAGVLGDRTRIRGALRAVGRAHRQQRRPRVRDPALAVPRRALGPPGAGARRLPPRRGRGGDRPPADAAPHPVPRHPRCRPHAASDRGISRPRRQRAVRRARPSMESPDGTPLPGHHQHHQPGLPAHAARADGRSRPTARTTSPASWAAGWLRRQAPVRPSSRPARPATSAGRAREEPS